MGTIRTPGSNRGISIHLSSQPLDDPDRMLVMIRPNGNGVFSTSIPTFPTKLHASLYCGNGATLVDGITWISLPSLGQCCSHALVHTGLPGPEGWKRYVRSKIHFHPFTYHQQIFNLVNILHVKRRRKRYTHPILPPA